MNSKQTLLSVKNLSVSFNTQKGLVNIINNLNFDIYPGENLAIVGESGSGKSVAALSILRLHDEDNTIYSNGSIEFKGKNLLTLADEIKGVRGKNISMIFQEPMTSLNPVFTVGQQIEEVLTLHENLNKAEKKIRVIELLDRVGIYQPEKKLNVYPHALSGGQRQRVMIAMALACNPDLLIADEPTTALDVTIQQQIIDLLLEIQQGTGMSVLFISHDLNLVRKFANLLPGGQPEENIFRLTLEMLRGFRLGIPIQIVASYFEIWLLKLSGLLPDHRECHHCSKRLRNQNFIYIAASGYLFCDTCRQRGIDEGKKITGSIYTALKDVLKNKIDSDKLNASLFGKAPLTEWTERLFKLAIEREIKSLENLKMIRDY